MLEDCETDTPFETSPITFVSTTGPVTEPPTLSLNPECIVAFVSLPLFLLYVLSFEKVNEDPLSMVAELFEPGGSLNTKSGICGPAVTNV